MPRSEKPRKKQQKFVSKKQKIVKLSISDDRLAHGLTKEQSSNFSLHRETMWFNALAHSLNSGRRVELPQMKEMATRLLTRWEAFSLAARESKDSVQLLFVFPENDVFTLHTVHISNSDVLMVTAPIKISLHAWSRIGHRSAHTTSNQAVMKVAAEHVSFVGMLSLAGAGDAEVLLISCYGKSVWTVSSEGEFLCITWIDGSQLHTEDRSILRQVGIGYEEPGIAVKVTTTAGKVYVFHGGSMHD